MIPVPSVILYNTCMSTRLGLHGLDSCLAVNTLWPWTSYLNLCTPFSHAVRMSGDTVNTMLVSVDTEGGFNSPLKIFQYKLLR